jgi:hypothetical protein
MRAAPCRAGALTRPCQRTRRRTLVEISWPVARMAGV